LPRGLKAPAYFKVQIITSDGGFKAQEMLRQPLAMVFSKKGNLF